MPVSRRSLERCPPAREERRHQDLYIPIRCRRRSFAGRQGSMRLHPALALHTASTKQNQCLTLTGLPLVMHGGSGVSEDDFRRAIKAGIRKINYYTYMSNAGSRAVRELLAKEDVTFFHDLAFAAQKAMQADAEKAMIVFMRTGSPHF